MIVAGREQPGAHRERCDICVIGSGAGGAVAAAELASSGLDVVLLEQGGYHTRADFDQREDHMFPLLFENAGLQATADGSIQILQGRGVGGSTVHNLGTCVRPPAAILELWQEEHGIRELDLLEASTERVERALGVREILPEELNALNRKIRQGSELLGYRGRIPRHNRIGCVRSGFCILGCSYDAKQSMLVTYVPRADGAGARIWSDCVSERIAAGPQGGWTVQASVVGPAGETHGELQVESRLVVCAAGAVSTPLLLRESGLGGSAVGESLHLHPSITAWGIFPEPIQAHYGIPQAYYIDEFLELERDPHSGTLLLPIAGFPAMLAAQLPGFGPELFEYLQHFEHLGGLATLLHDRSSGRIERGITGRPAITYQLGSDDRRELVKGLKHAVEVLWASGAERVIVPYTHEPLVLRPADGTAALDRRGVREGILPISSAHPQASCPMGTDPASSVVGSFGEVHGAAGVFVADASVFPTSLGVPPQITTAALADRTAQHIRERWGEFSS